MNDSIVISLSIISLSATAVLAGALLLSSCGNDIQIAKQPKHDAHNAPVIAAAPLAPTPVDPHEKDAERTAYTNPIVPQTQAVPASAQEVEDRTDSSTVDQSGTNAQTRSDVELQPERAVRATEDTRMVPDQTEDPARAERIRQDAAQHPAASESQSDIDIGIEIRRAIMAQNGLSELSKNIKVITKDGVVVLRGSVQTSSEMVTICDIAQQAPGVRSVVNELEVAP